MSRFGKLPPSKTGCARSANLCSNESKESPHGDERTMPSLHVAYTTVIPRSLKRLVPVSKRRPEQLRSVLCDAHKITVLPGDGIGPEIAKVAVKVLKAAGQACGEEFQFKEELIGGAAM